MGIVRVSDEVNFAEWWATLMLCISELFVLCSSNRDQNLTHYLSVFCDVKRTDGCEPLVRSYRQKIDRIYRICNIYEMQTYILNKIL